MALLYRVEKYIVTASQDSPDVWGCTDHAIGFCDADCTSKEAAHGIVTGYWRAMLEEYDQNRWAYLFDEGLIGSEEAERWADEVWVPEADMWEDEEHLD